jgi:hypothetical protein
MRTKMLFKSLLVLIGLSMSAPVVSDPPAQSGPNVMRFDGGVAFSIPDFDAGTQVILGVNMIEFCNDFFNPDTVPFMDINVPEDSDRIKQLFKGEVQASVWGFSEFNCARFLSELPLGQGMVQVHGNDNDLIVFLRDNQNANSFGIRANGDMWSPATGEQLKFHLVWHVVWDGADGDKFKEMVKISLK